MKQKVIFIFAILLSWSNAYSFNSNIQCPTVNTIVSVGLDPSKVAYDEDSFTWAIGIDSKYGTSQNWTFVLQKIYAKTKEEVYSAALLALPNLRFQDQLPSNDCTLCVYDT